MMDGDGVSDAALAEMASVAVPRGERDLAAESMFEYGSRVGFWRLHRIFQERGLPMTVYACAIALERNPPAATAMRGRLRHLLSWLALGRALQARRGDRTGAYPPRGREPRANGRTATARWYCRYGPSVNTRRLVVEEGGFLYDSDSCADELPIT